MVRKHRTKRKRGDVWAQLSVSACVLLLPPIVMAAGVMVFGSPLPQMQQGAVQEAAVPQAAAAANGSVSVGGQPVMRPNGTTSFALASADPHSVITERRPAAAEPWPASAQPAAAAQRAPTGQAAATKDPARYVTAAPVTLVHVGNASEQSAMVEAPPPAAADAPAAVPEGSPAATRTHGFHVRGRMGWHQPHPAYRVRYQRTRSLSDIFVRPTARSRTTRRG
jgi:hypothetical protein